MTLAKRWEYVFGVKFVFNAFDRYLNKADNKHIDRNKLDIDIILRFLQYEQKLDAHDVVT
jgi:hypothetical protein